MSVYRVAVGTDVALGSLAALEPQPRSTGIQTVERSHAISGQVYEHAKYIRLIFDFLESDLAYQNLIQQFGVDTDLTAAVTVYLRNYDFTWVRMNGLAVRPEVGRGVEWQAFFPRNIEVLIKNLVAAS